MKAIFIFFILISIFIINCFSQEKENNEEIRIVNYTDSLVLDVRISIVKILGRHLNHDKLFKTPRNNAFLFSIAFFVNSQGQIENVYFSENSSKTILSIIEPNQKLKDNLKKVLITDEKLKNKILVLPILFKRPEDTSIVNLSDFLYDYLTFWPTIPIGNSLNIPIVLLKPFINDFFDTIH